MSEKNFVTLDGNEATAYVAYRTNEVISIYPITPSSPMGEWSDAWASQGIKNIWGTVPTVLEMQSEGGAAGALHGALQAGTLSTTFTASQGLLLMIPNMFKIAGELTPNVIHVSARTVATHALSIFGDHSDVMATRSTGYAMLASASVQEAMDFALVAQKATMESRIPFLHFFDGFRTSHEISKIEVLSEDVIKAMIDNETLMQHRKRSLLSDRPVLRGTAQNPDVFFQARETVNKYYDVCSDIIDNAFNKFAELTGRKYSLFEYLGAEDAEKVIVLMGSGCETVEETVNYLAAQGEKVGVIKVRCYRPFDVKRFMESIPASVKTMAILDRTKEPGATGEPLYNDCITAIHEGLELDYGSIKEFPKVFAGRYGLSSKEFTPAMIKGVFDHVVKENAVKHFTVGINDDVTHLSIDFDPDFSTEASSVTRALFYGLGSDGTVGANKNSIKIIGTNTDNYAQGYFVYDSKKAGAVTISHLRFGPEKIKSTYLISKANFLACHQTVFIEKYDMLKNLVDGGTFLLNTKFHKDEAWNSLPVEMQQQIIDKKIKFYVIDAYKTATQAGMELRINTIMQTCFFAISGVIAKEEAIDYIKTAIKKTYGKKGDEIVAKNIQAVDSALQYLEEVTVPENADSKLKRPSVVSDKAPEYVKDVLSKIMVGDGDSIPVSGFDPDGTFPTATTKWEKRAIAMNIPSWDKDVCIQCGKCSMVCPHAVIRMKVYEPALLENAPSTFKSCDPKNKAWAGKKFTIQVSPEDCTGCGACVNICPAKNKQEEGKKAINMTPLDTLKEQEKDNWDYFLTIPEVDRSSLKINMVREQQMQRALFEFSGACAGCGETPYVKLLSQLFGDRAIIANATGCSSIYGGNLPTTPWAKNDDGRGPAWSNSLFEDNAEFGLGMRLSIDKQTEFALELLQKLSGEIGSELVNDIVNAEQKDEQGIFEQRDRVAQLKEKLKSLSSDDAKFLVEIADYFVKKSSWILGGDGWAYDIGYGGLDHVLASGRNVNVLVVDTEVYSNTGGQMSKATPRGAIAKFAMAGKPLAKKDLGMIAMSYGNIYVASVAMGANDSQTLKAFIEAEKYDGPSLIIAYSHCIAHGINMTTGMNNQKIAVNTGQWLLYRYNPDLAAEGKNPLILDSKKPTAPVKDFMNIENRFMQLVKSRPEDAARLFAEAQKDVDKRWAQYEYLAAKS